MSKATGAIATAALLSLVLAGCSILPRQPDLSVVPVAPLPMARTLAHVSTRANELAGRWNAAATVAMPAQPPIDLRLLFSEQPISAQPVLKSWSQLNQRIEHTSAQLSSALQAVESGLLFDTEFAAAATHIGSQPAFSGAQHSVRRMAEQLQIQLQQLLTHQQRVSKVGYDYVSLSGEILPALETAIGGEDESIAATTVTGLLDWMEVLSDNLSAHSAELLVVERQLRALYAAQPFGEPVSTATITSMYGPRRHPISGKHKLHTGMDFAAPKGTEIRAVAAGRVSYVGVRGGYGRVVEIDHGNGYTTLYAHNSSNIAKKGSYVSRGEVIAKVGRSGKATGPHLHFEIRKAGVPTNPVRYVRAQAAL